MNGGGQLLVRDVGEDALVAAVLARYAAARPGADRSGPERLLVGPGDDAAVLDAGHGALVVCTDTLVQDQDFTLAWSSGHDVGVKCAAQNFADVAAMGARPTGLLVSLSVPGEVPLSWVTGLADGIAQECTRAGATVLGGDVSAAGQVSLTGTALGRLAGAAVRRSGARVGDVVALGAPTGWAAAGLDLLRAGWTGGGGPALGRPAAGVLRSAARALTAQRAPRPDYASGPVAALAGATALIDTSDGLARDGARIARASGVCLRLRWADLAAPARELAELAELAEPAERGEPAEPAERGAPGVPGGSVPDATARRAPDARWRGWVLTGGEDHALLACFPPGRLPAPFRAVGTVGAARPDGALVLVDDRPLPGSPGWTHFAG